MEKTKTELINKYSSSIINHIISFAREYTGDPVDLDENRDIPVFTVELKKYLIKFVQELEKINE